MRTGSQPTRSYATILPTEDKVIAKGRLIYRLLCLATLVLTGCTRFGPDVTSVTSPEVTATKVVQQAKVQTLTPTFEAAPRLVPTLVPTGEPPQMTALPRTATISAASPTVWPSATPKISPVPSPASPTVELPTMLPSPMAVTPSSEQATPSAPIAATAPSNASPQRIASSYLLSPRPDGSLSRVDGINKMPIQIAPPTEPWAELPWAAAPDGRTIAFISGVGVWPLSRGLPGAPTMALWMVDARGTHLRKVQNILPARRIDLAPDSDDRQGLLVALSTQPVWSPDGAEVAFVSAHQGETDLYAASVSGVVRRLTKTVDFETAPQWSPDGRYLAYLTATDFGMGGGWSNAGFGVVARGGGTPLLSYRNLQYGDGESATQLGLAWIGTSGIAVSLAALIASTPDVWFYPVPNGVRTHIGSLTSTFPDSLEWNATARRLTVVWSSPTPGKFLQFWQPGDAEATTLPDGPVDRFAWNRDGTLLAYSIINRSGDRTLFIWRPGAAHGDAISPEPVDDFAWDPTGKMLAFDVPRRASKPGVYRWSPDAPTLRIRISKQSDVPISWSLDGHQLAVGTTIYSPEGRQLGTLAGAHVDALAWGPQGLFYRTSPTQSRDLRDTSLWLWDGKVTHQLDSGLSWNTSTRLVVLRR